MRLTFSQREGKAPLPEPMRLEYLSKRFRNFVWLYLDEAIEDSNTGSMHGSMYEQYERSKIHDIIKKYTILIKGDPHDSIEHTSMNHKILLRPLILNGEYHDVLTLIEFVMEKSVHSTRPVIRKLDGTLRRLFDSVPIAYTVQQMQNLPTIIPRSSPEAGAATVHAIQTVEQKGSEGAKAHLRKAVKRLNAKQYGDSVKESISAVESVARTIDPKASKELRPALDSLEKADVLRHKAFIGALNKLYAYTSDEEGIRHSLLDERAPDVDLDEAVFMFGACAVFCDYLLNRRQQIT